MLLVVGISEDDVEDVSVMDGGAELDVTSTEDDEKGVDEGAVTAGESMPPAMSDSTKGMLDDVEASGGGCESDDDDDEDDVAFPYCRLGRRGK